MECDKNLHHPKVRRNIQIILKDFLKEDNISPKKLTYTAKREISDNLTNAKRFKSKRKELCVELEDCMKSKIKMTDMSSGDCSNTKCGTNALEKQVSIRLEDVMKLNCNTLKSCVNTNKYQSSSRNGLNSQEISGLKSEGIQHLIFDQNLDLNIKSDNYFSSNTIEEQFHRELGYFLKSKLAACWSFANCIDTNKKDILFNYHQVDKLNYLMKCKFTSSCSNFKVICNENSFFRRPFFKKELRVKVSDCLKQNHCLSKNINHSFIENKILSDHSQNKFQIKSKDDLICKNISDNNSAINNPCKKYLVVHLEDFMKKKTANCGRKESLVSSPKSGQIENEIVYDYNKPQLQIRLVDCLKSKDVSKDFSHTNAVLNKCTENRITYNHYKPQLRIKLVDCLKHKDISKKFYKTSAVVNNYAKKSAFESEKLVKNKSYNNSAFKNVCINREKYNNRQLRILLSDCVKLKARRVKITNEERRIILNYETLTGDLINKFGEILAAQTNFKQQNVLHSQVPEFIKPIEDPHIQILYCGSVKHIGHWICTYFDGKVINIYNSASFVDLSPCGNLFLERLFPHKPPLKYHQVQQQNNNVNCGVFAIAYATSLAFGRDPVEEIYNVKVMRKHLISIYENKIIIPFPTLSATQNGND